MKVIIASVIKDRVRSIVVLGIATSDKSADKIIRQAEKEYSLVFVKKIVEIEKLDEFVPLNYLTNCIDIQG